MKEIKITFDTVKKLLANKRTRSGVILFFYLIFFTIIIAFLRNNTPLEKPIDKTLKSYNDMHNYSYVITINKNDVLTDTITGKRFDNKELIVHNELSYFYKDNVLVGFPVTEIDITKLRVDYIYQYLDTLIGTEVDFVKPYVVPLSRFMKVANNVDIKSDKTIIIRTTTTDGIINIVSLDLTNYVNYNSNLYIKYEVIITYNSFNQVLDFDNN